MRTRALRGTNTDILTTSMSDCAGGWSAAVYCCERWTGTAGQGMVGETPGGAGQFRLDEEDLMPASIAMVST
jgi:hypothetical protein